MTEGYFQYYWLEIPKNHPYDLECIEIPTPNFTGDKINSLNHLKWGLYRIYVDALLYYGSIRTAYREMRDMDHSDIKSFFASKRFDTKAIKRRGPPLDLKPIDQDSRHLVSEIACKTCDTSQSNVIQEALLLAYQAYKAEGISDSPTVSLLLVDSTKTENQQKTICSQWLPNKYHEQVDALKLCCNQYLDDEINSEDDIANISRSLEETFKKVRKDAQSNTQYYLSMVQEMDVYVATSMRVFSDFINVAKFCDNVFVDQRLQELNLRFFDPTLSAAKGHEDKGLIECLMVKCAKALIFLAGKKDSFGKDSEAAMALSHGHPVIFYCDDEKRKNIYKDIHPLSRLIEIETGVAVGAIITDTESDVVEIITRLFENKMRYKLEAVNGREGYFRLREEITDSVVRIQTDDQMLTEAFWNNYHKGKAQMSDVSIEPTSNIVAIDAFREKTNSDVDNIEANYQSSSDAEVKPDLFSGSSDDQGLVKIAARESNNETRFDTSKAAAPTTQHDINMTYAEIYRGISNGEGKTGQNRTTVFSGWCDNNNITKDDAIQFAHFVVNTINENSYSKTFVFSESDLNKWFAERNTKPYGSKQ